MAAFDYDYCICTASCCTCSFRQLNGIGNIIFVVSAPVERERSLHEDLKRLNISSFLRDCWWIWVGWKRQLPQYVAVDASRLRRTRSLPLQFEFGITKVVPASRERRHHPGHSPRRRSSR